jgi:hypothetical protein
MKSNVAAANLGTTHVPVSLDDWLRHVPSGIGALVETEGQTTEQTGKLDVRTTEMQIDKTTATHRSSHSSIS